MDKQKYKDSIFDEKHDKRTIIHHYSLIPPICMWVGWGGEKHIFQIHDIGREEKKKMLSHVYK